jgi:hypothetical protein
LANGTCTILEGVDGARRESYRTNGERMIQLQYTDGADPLRDGIKVMLYGQYGIGKTPLLATAPLPVIISAENGLLSLRRQHVPYIEVKSIAGLDDAMRWIVQSSEAKQFYTYGLDSVSEIAETCLAEEKRKTKDPRKAFGEIIDKVIERVRWFRDMPGKSVVVVAKEEWTKEEDTGITRYRPMMPGQKLGPQLPYFFDEVFRMIQHPGDPRYRCLCTKTTFQHAARDRSGMLEEFEQPDLTVVFKKILGF